MAGAVIENVSSKKLYTGCCLVFALCVGGFVLGGVFVQSKPNVADTNIASECVEDGSIVYMPWHPENAPDEPNQQCIIATEEIKNTLNPTQLVHSLHIPKQWDVLSRWRSYLLVMIHPTLRYIPQSEYGSSQPNDTRIYFDAKIFYRDDLSESWTLYHESVFSREYKCFATTPIPNDEYIDYICDPMHFIELGSIPHKYYLINFKLPMIIQENEIAVQVNGRIGRIEHMNLPVIFQPPEFTKVWLGLQTFVFVSLWFPLSWFLNRIYNLNRPQTLIEKSIMALGIGMQIANFPMQWIALVCDASWMLLASDVRVGLAYFMLFTFWLIFMNEHLLDRPNRNNLNNYRYQLFLVIICALAMFLFDLIERGIQLRYPFWSVWDTTHGKNAAYAMPVVGGACGVLYTSYLLFIVAKVSFNLIKRKEHFVGRLHAEGLIIRFQAIIMFTIFCAVFSLVSFFYNEVTDAPTIVSGYHVEVQSAMYTGLYVLWNGYVLSVILLYAPSHKLHYNQSEIIPLTSGHNSETTSISASRADSLQTISHQSTANILAPLTQQKSQTE